MTALEDVKAGEWGYVEHEGQRYKVKNTSSHDWVKGETVKEYDIPERWK